MPYKGIIFDFNGVLLWDTPLHVKAWERISHKVRGKKVTAEEIDAHVHGRPNGYIFEYLLNRPLSVHEIQSLAKQKESYYQELCLQNKEAFILSEGTIELLEFLANSQIPYTIATASDKFNLDFFIHHLQLTCWFDLSKIVYDDGTFPSKPAPDTYLKAAAKLNLYPSECVAVEDSKTGLLAATQAKIGKVIALGPSESHAYLTAIPGVSEAICSLAEIRKELFA